MHPTIKNKLVSRLVYLARKSNQTLLAEFKADPKRARHYSYQAGNRNAYIHAAKMLKDEL